MPDLLPSDVALAPGDVGLVAGDVADAPDLLPGDEADPPEGPCECCGAAACADFGASVCFSLVAAGCANLDSRQVTGAEVLPAGACRHWAYAGSSIVSGGCTFAVNVDFYCGCGADPCPDAAAIPTCAYATVGGTTNCAGGGTWRLVTVPDGTNAKLPVVFAAGLAQPVGTVTGYVVPGAGESDCSCPCPKNTPVTLTVTNGACIGVIVCSELTPSICVTLASDCAALDGTRITGTIALGPLCEWRTGAGFGAGAGPPGCSFNVEFDLFCGCNVSSPCPDIATFPGCAYIAFNPQNNCTTTPPFASRYRIVTVPNGTKTRLPITWVQASPPIGIASGYVVPGEGQADDCTCPCPKNTAVEILVTSGAC